jgi:hypothetical protein
MNVRNCKRQRLEPVEAAALGTQRAQCPAIFSIRQLTQHTFRDFLVAISLVTLVSVVTIALVSVVSFFVICVKPYFHIKNHVQCMYVFVVPSRRITPIELSAT